MTTHDSREQPGYQSRSSDSTLKASNSTTTFLFKRPNHQNHSWYYKFNWIMSALDISLLLGLVTIHFDLDKSAIIGLLSVVLAVIFPVFVEKVQRPELRIVAATKEQTTWKHDTFWATKLHVHHDALPNDVLHLWAKSWLERRNATRCHGAIRFLTLQGEPIITNQSTSDIVPPRRFITSAFQDNPSLQHQVSLPENDSHVFAGTINAYQMPKLTTTVSGIYNQTTPPWWEVDSLEQPIQEASSHSKKMELGPMVLRWAGSTQPSEPAEIIKIDGRQGTIHHYVTEVDISPGEENAIDVVIQYQNDQCCYGWNNEIYFLPSPKHSSWKLSPGIYHVEVKVFYGDRVLQEIFVLNNTGNVDEITIKSRQPPGQPNHAVQPTPLARS